jgi:hypothetical protein
LELEPEIQDLIAAGEFPRGRPTVTAIKSIPEGAARVQTAKVLASKRADVQLIKATCTRVRKKLQHQSGIRDAARNGREYVPALEAALEEGLPPENGAAIDWQDVKGSVDEACKACELAEDYDIPVGFGWSLIWQDLADSAEGHCAACAVRDSAEICAQCPMVEFFKRMTRRVGR